MSRPKVYLVGTTQMIRVKIGKSNDPSRRLQQLQTGSPEKLECLCYGDFIPETTEAILHKDYCKYRIIGEHFEIPLQEFLKLYLRILGLPNAAVPNFYSIPDIEEKSDYTKYTVKELKSICTELGIRRVSRLNKQALITLLEIT
jgi:hypothetical protein